MKKATRPGAALIASGFAGTAIGAVLAVVGVMVNAAEVAPKYGAPTNLGMGWLVIGLILVVCGAIALATGFYNLAANVESLMEADQREARLPE